MDLIEYQNKMSETRHPWEQARIEVVYRLIEKFFPIDSEASVLDIGCGDTFVINELQKRRPQSKFYAVDTAFDDELIRKFSSENIRLLKNINELEISKAGLILLMDVIEHIEDERKFLKELVQKQFVQEDTLFLITVPAWQSLFSAHDKFLKHYRRYSAKQLHKTLQESGLNVIEKGYFFISLLLPRLLNLGKEKLFGEKEVKGLASWQGSRKQAQLIKEILLLDFKTNHFLDRKLGLRLPGLSSYALCRKSAL